MRFVFENGLVVSKGPRRPPEGVQERERRAAPFRLWVREAHPEAIGRLMDGRGTFRFSRENGELMLELTSAWLAAGAPGRITD